MLDHLVDLESDFSAIHRVDNIYDMDGPRFFQFASRMFAYRGVMRAKAEEEMDRKGKKGRGQPVERVGIDEFQARTGGAYLNRTVVS